MIVFFVTAQHDYTLRALTAAETGLDIRIMHYGQLPAARMLPRATFIMTDLDRLSTDMLERSADVCRQLRSHGLKVLNDPVRVLSRFGLLRALFREGLNRFNAYRVEEGVVPLRWPVFLRTEGTHSSPLPELYHSAESLALGIQVAIAKGLPKSRLLIVEFMGEPIRPGLYRKLSNFRIGDASVAHTCVHDDQWIAKDGKLGIATPDLYEDELRIVRDNPYGPAVAKAFGIAAIEYGRMDFGIVGGEIQVYEINTNPDVQLHEEHPAPIRLESYRLFRENLIAALKSIDTPPPRAG